MPVALRFIGKTLKTGGVPPSSLGLDIQPKAIHLVKIRQFARKRVVEQLLTKELPSSLQASDVLAQGGLSRALAEVVRECQLGGQSVAISLPVSHVSLERMQLPVAYNEEGIEKAIRQRYTTREPDSDYCIDFSIEEESVPGYWDVELAMVQSSFIKQWVNCVNNAGLQLKLIDIDIYALVRAVCQARHWQVPVNKLGAILFATATQAQLIGFSKKRVLFQQRYSVQEMPNLAVLIKQQLQAALTMHSLHELHPLLVCSDHKILLPDLPMVECEHPFMAMQFAEGVTMPVDPQRYWLACGLALRELPR